MIIQMPLLMIEEFCRNVQYSPSRNFRGIALLRDGVLVAATGYDHWTPNSVQMHVWVPHPKKLGPAFVRESFRYPFEIGGRGLVVGITPSDNAAALRFNKHIGFREVYRVKDAWSEGVDMVVQEMRKDECRWLRKEVA